jgi:signal transduction histidine kinase
MKIRTRAVPLAAQLIATMGGLVLATATALSLVAYRSSVESLRAGARATVSAAVTHPDEAITRVLLARRRNAEGLLASARALCGESAGGTRLSWAEDCVRPLLQEFRITEGAMRAELRDARHVVARSGSGAFVAPSTAGTFAQMGRTGEGTAAYQIQAAAHGLRLVAVFDLQEFAQVLTAAAGRDGPEVLFADDAGHALIVTDEGHTESLSPEAREMCRALPGGTTSVIDPTRQVFHAVRRVASLGPACLSAKLRSDAALRPAETLRQSLITGGSLFAALGVVASLIAARWIAQPIRRLAAVAERVKEGKFEYNVAATGPAEVRALGRALRAMAVELDRRMTGEQTAREEAQNAAGAKDTLIAVVSHELRTPLTAILGWSEMLTTRQLDPMTVRRGLEAIHGAAESQRQLVDDLLDASRLAKQQLTLTFGDVDLPRVIHNAANALRPHADSKGIHLEVHVEATSMLVRGDAERLQQVVLNLASNAVKFTPTEGRVRITLERDGDMARLRIADSGQGISAAILPHIFEWFRQGESAPNRRYAGLGIGLGLVRQFVELHGGHVHAESQGEGRGSTFVVSLPLIATSALAILATAPTPSSFGDQRLAGIRVLVIEDDAPTRMMLQTALAAAGAVVMAVASAQDARSVIADATPQVVVSDIAMPGEDGYTLMRSWRATRMHVPAIALTAHARPQDVTEAQAAGFQLHVAKPVSPAQLIDAVASVIQPSSHVA